MSCFILVENRTAPEVAGMFGGHLLGPPPTPALWSSAGIASNGWGLIVDPHFEFGDEEDELRRWSAGTRIGRLQVIERELFSHGRASDLAEMIYPRRPGVAESVARDLAS